jgi:hypothetical protein
VRVGEGKDRTAAQRFMVDVIGRRVGRGLSHGWTPGESVGGAASRRGTGPDIVCHLAMDSCRSVNQHHVSRLVQTHRPPHRIPLHGRQAE